MSSANEQEEDENADFKFGHTKANIRQTTTRTMDIGTRKTHFGQLTLVWLSLAVQLAQASALDPRDSIDLRTSSRNQPQANFRPQIDAEPEHEEANRSAGKLQIVRLFAPEAVQNGTQNVTIDCMFKFDKKLDRKLAIKWFFNDELEPIYQWIPELNKRVYSDRYERFLDKNYQVSDDLEFMLQSYNKLEAVELSLPVGEEARSQLARKLRRRLLLDDQSADGFSLRFRALRLVAPSRRLSGKFTCSISSLDHEDLQSTRLVVYEPAANFTFQVARAAGGQQFNLSCRAAPVYPRPGLTLLRYRAGSPEAASWPRPPLAAAAQLRAEPIAGQRILLTTSGGSSLEPLSRSSDEPPDELTNELSLGPATQLERAAAEQTDEAASELSYEIAAWALVDEATLSANLMSQFECVLTVEHTNYEQRQSLALQKGWHINSAASLAVRSTLVGLFGLVALCLCLTLAFVITLVIFKLWRSKAAASFGLGRRIHDSDSAAPPGGAQPSGRLKLIGGQTNLAAQLESGQSKSPSPVASETSKEKLAAANGAELPVVAPDEPSQSYEPFGQLKSIMASDSVRSNRQQVPGASDGIYRVPEKSTFGARFVQPPPPTLNGSQSDALAQYERSWTGHLIGARLQQQQQSQLEATSQVANGSEWTPANRRTAGQHQRTSLPTTISVNGKSLYC